MGATVYYIRGRAELCALEYGWFSWAASLSLFWIGGATLTASVVCLPAGHRQKFAWYAGWASIVYAFGLIFIGPSAVRVGELLWHTVAWLGAMPMAGVYGKLRRLTTPPQAMQPSARRSPVESCNASQTPTADLVLALVFLITWTAAATDIGFADDGGSALVTLEIDRRALGP